MRCADCAAFGNRKSSAFKREFRLRKKETGRGEVQNVIARDKVVHTVSQIIVLTKGKIFLYI